MSSPTALPSASASVSVLDPRPPAPTAGLDAVRPGRHLRGGPRPPRRRRVWSIAALVALLVAVTMGGDAMFSRRAGHPVFFGIDVPGASATGFAQVAGALGVTPTVSALFLKLDSRSVPAKLAAIPPRVTPFVTVEPWSVDSRWGDSSQSRYSLATIIAGAHDSQLLALAHDLAAAHRTVYLRFAHEMNGSWYPWAEAVNGNQAGQYQAAWRHAHDVMAPVLGTQARWVWAPNSLRGAAPNSPTLHELYPGDAYVDYLGLTAYGHGETVQQTFCPTVAALKTVSRKPIVLAEVGVTGPHRVSWLEALGPFVAAESQIAGVVYFNTSPETTGATADYRLDADPQAAKALGKAVVQMSKRPDGGGC